MIEWPGDQPGAPARYRIGGFTLALSASADPEDERLRRSRLDVALAGHAPIIVDGGPAFAESVMLSVGRWGDGRPYVLFQSHSGGSHCCTRVVVVLPEDGRLRAIPVGTWDGEFVDPPTDVDGDGALDFVVPDNRFLYAFASYAGSRAPPRILNVVDRRAVDVSAAPRYRPLFLRAMEEERADCLAGGAEANGPCAAFVAAAARVGRFDRAWQEMLPHYERAPAFGLPRGCRVRAELWHCPQGREIGYASFPDALSAFLTATGYLPAR